MLCAPSSDNIDFLWTTNISFYSLFLLADQRKNFRLFRSSLYFSISCHFKEGKKSLRFFSNKNWQKGKKIQSK
jgi:hypothetical protein